MRCAARALTFTAFSFAALLGPMTAYSQDQTPPPTQQGSAPSATETPGTSGPVSSASGNAAPSAQAPTVQLPPVVVITKSATARKPKKVGVKPSLAAVKPSSAKAATGPSVPSATSAASANGTAASGTASKLAVKNATFDA